MKRCEAGKRREINATITQAFATCTTLALQFYSNDVRVAEVPETGEHPRDFHILRTEPRSAEPPHWHRAQTHIVSRWAG